MNPARAYLRSHRGRPASWSDRYVTGFSLVLGLVLLGQPVATVLGGLARTADPARIGAGLALIAAAYAGLLALARAVGPIALPAADAAWLVLSPLPRRSVVLRSALILLVTAVVAGGVLGVAGLAVLGSTGSLGPHLMPALVIGVTVSVAGAATAVLAQASQTWDTRLQVLVAGCVLAAVLAALLSTVLGGGPGRQVLVAVAAAPASVVTAVAGLAAAAAALLVRQAWAALDRLPARGVLASSEKAGRVASAAVAMDPGALSWIAEDNHWRGRTLRSRPWPRLAGRWRAAAPAWQEWRRLSRRPGRLALLYCCAALPALAAQATGGLSALPVVALFGGALGAAATATTGARRDGDDPSLARLLAVGPRAVMAARTLLPTALAASWLVLALSGLAVAGLLPSGLWWALGVATAPALSAGALRMARRAPIDHSMPMVEIPGSPPLPIGLLLWALTGLDLVLVGCLPALAALGAPPASLASHVATQAVAGLAVLIGFVRRRPAR
ncbi:hypothetical protein JOL79_29770 [Microbispora sp. RL4-1S]|uniref:Uncharacterized protein n=1 Tax=Microbispora oryzae TaxID=2806554 RepID=A0A940WQZ7_9ACTN|nr:DUF6297 family protein [Microbispora oryzae]MBP2707977.1 hypothetical protein [Microbispora oryzae]